MLNNVFILGLDRHKEYSNLPDLNVEIKQYWSLFMFGMACVSVMVYWCMSVSSFAPDYVSYIMISHYGVFFSSMILNISITITPMNSYTNPESKNKSHNRTA